MHRIPDNPYILWVENVRNKQSSGQTRLMKQLCLTLPLIGNEEECPDSRQSHRAVHRTVVRRVCGSGKPAQYPYSNSNASRAMDTNGGVRSKGERFSQADVTNVELNPGSCPQAGIQPQVPNLPMKL